MSRTFRMPRKVGRVWRSCVRKRLMPRAETMADHLRKYEALLTRG